MRRRIVIGVVVVIVVIAGWWGYVNLWSPSASDGGEETDQETEQVSDLENVIWASGTLEPVLWAGLSPALSGIVAEILVEEGQWIEQGDVLLRLNTDVPASQVEMARSQLAEAQAALDQLLAGATDAELAAAEARVETAAAQVALAAGQMLEAQAAIDAAAAQVEIAEREYAEMASHPTAAELTVARAEVAIAESAVSQTQAAYNLVRGDPQIGSRPESLALYQATAELEAARARAALTEQGPTAEQLAVAQSQVAAARVRVDEARSRAPGVEAAVQAAMAEQAGAQAALDQLLAGATAGEIAMGRAHVAAVEAAVASAEASLRQSIVVAPFDGQVGAINVRLGEMVTAEQFVILVGDTSRMHIRTTDLRETDVVRLDVGMEVEVTFDALPDQIFTGMITRIAPVSNTEQGSTNYTIDVDVDELDEDLRWGMTAFVNIQAPR